MSVETATALPTEGLFNIDPVHSTVSFRVGHAGVATFRSGFDGISGSFDAGSGVLAGEVPVSGLTIGLEMFKQHLLSEDWFAAEQHPTIAFTSTSIAGESGEFKFVGDFTLKGVTKEITGTGLARGPVTAPGPGGEDVTKLGVDISAVIDRSEFGMLADGAAANDVKFDIALELVKA